MLQRYEWWRHNAVQNLAEMKSSLFIIYTIFSCLLFILSADHLEKTHTSYP